MNDKPKDVIRETDVEAIRLAKTLTRAARFGALAVIDPETGAPLASRVGVATDADGTPLILVSQLSAHTPAIMKDPRCSLLVGEPGKGDPLAHPRITLVCRARKLESGTPERIRAERRYLNRNPKAKLYVGLGDFSFFRLEVERASLNGGFGKAYLLTRGDLIVEGPVVVATDADGTPLILVSQLSAHTPAIMKDPRCSLLVGEPGKGDPLAHPRITLVCRARKLESGTPERIRAERRYLNRNPKAKLYVGLGDFSFFRLEVERASLNGGFGKAYLLTRGDLIVEGPVVEALAELEQRAVDHMNDDHLDAVANYARYFAKADGGGWIMTGIDVDGIDIAAGDDVRRVFFPTPLKDAQEMRMALVEMAKEARQALASQV